MWAGAAAAVGAGAGSGATGDTCGAVKPSQRATAREATVIAAFVRRTRYLVSTDPACLDFLILSS
jgi:hypothetical protein